MPKQTPLNPFLQQWKAENRRNQEVVAAPAAHWHRKLEVEPPRQVAKS